MNLREIPNYLNIRVRRECWEPKAYWYFNGLVWLNHEEERLYQEDVDLYSRYNDWESYEEEPRKKRL